MTLFNVQFDLLKRVTGYGQKFAALVPSDSFAGRCFVTIGNAVNQLRQYAGPKSAAAAELRKQKALRNEASERLVQLLDAVNATAKAIDRETPGFAQRYRLSHRLRYPALLRTAATFANEATADTEIFVQHDLAPGFVQEIIAAASRLEEAIEKHAASQSVCVSTNALIEAALADGMEAFRQLSAVLPIRLKDDLDALREWEIASRLPARTSKPVKSDPAATDPPDKSTAATAAA